MKYILLTRLIHWKKHWLTLLFWLLLPFIATTVLLNITNTVKEDSGVPVGVVMKDKSEEANDLLNAMESAKFIHVTKIDETEARHQLKKHQLDSVFIIHDNYEKGVQQDNRNHLLTSYQSDLSFAYTPVKEMVLSYIQQETGRSKAVQTVKGLADHYGMDNSFSGEDVTAKAMEIQTTEDLLKTSFTFGESPTETTDEPKLVSIWGLWAVFAMLSTFLLFDWIIHEKHAQIKYRFPFMRYSFKQYLSMNGLVYTVLCLITDLGTISLFWVLFQEQISIWSMFVFRILLNTAVFLFANLFKHSFLYYTATFALTLVFAVGSGAIIPVSGITDKWPWIEMLNPLQPFLSGGYWNLSSWIILISAVLWYCRKERFHASR